MAITINLKGKPKGPIQAMLKWDGHEKFSGFKYWWLKRVHGFDPSCHCAGCLKGSYSKAIAKDSPTNTWMTFRALKPEAIYYMCGVSVPYVWSYNFHLAFVAGTEELEIPMYNGCTLIMKNVKRVNFDEARAYKDYPGRGKSFLTCRNFQFGAQLFPHKDVVHAEQLALATKDVGCKHE